MILHSALTNSATYNPSATGITLNAPQCKNTHVLYLMEINVTTSFDSTRKKLGRMQAGTKKRTRDQREARERQAAENRRKFPIASQLMNDGQAIFGPCKLLMASENNQTIKTKNWDRFINGPFSEYYTDQDGILRQKDGTKKI